MGNALSNVYACWLKWRRNKEARWFYGKNYDALTGCQKNFIDRCVGSAASKQ